MMNNFTIEQATLQDMLFFLAWAKAEGWNPGLNDAEPFFSTDPNGFFIGKLDGKTIGCISAVAFNNDYGFVGFYIIAPEYRGMGYGLRLWRHAISYLGNRTMGLDGVVAQQDNYKKSGFKFFYNNIRYGGKGKGKLDKELQSIHKIPFETLVDFDASIYGIDRARFLRHWIQMPNSCSLAKTISNQLVGYGVMRQCGIGYKIGPLFADDALTAREIFLALLAKSGNAEVFLDVPQTNSAAILLAQEQNFKPLFETARMYRGNPPNQLLPKVFGITTFELG